MEKKLRILVDPSPRSINEIFADNDWSALSDTVEILRADDAPISAGEMDRFRADIDVLVGGEWRYGELPRFESLKAFMEVSGRHPDADRLDYRHAFANGVRVLSCAPAFGPQVAEMSLAMVLDAAREISLGDAKFKAGTEEYMWDGNRTTFTLFGKRVGIIGYGNIAETLQSLMIPYGCSFYAYDPWLPPRFMERAGVTPASLEEVMSTSDVVFVLAIVSKENRRMINGDLLRSMKPGAVFGLFSRAHVVDFNDLVEVLGERNIKAAIDVFPEEPLSSTHPIRTAPNTVLSAHRAGSVAEDLKLIGRMVLEDIEAIAAGIPPRRLQGAEPEIVNRL